MNAPETNAHETSVHVVRKSLYVGVFAALIVLWLAQAGLDAVPLGAFHTPVALLIAAVKAALVALFFMHLRWDTSLTRVFAVAGLVWLGILLALTLADVLTRGWLLGAG